MANDCPVFMDKRKKTIHKIRYFLEMRRRMVTEVNWFLSIAPAKLSNVCKRSVVQRPQRVFIESFKTLVYSDLDAV